ncbi:MAG: hypothetical protein KDC31_09315 [Saprospiraceae bacterium]|jgi:hypothetical protein|nr:hypothetical protein [Saprospiraceae bacterium]MCB0591479.1 hypothetical protein [Saprospiraceae bacterium]MCO5282221.1 hypothetical protein [Saprospiraceae bacterium]MCO6471645.1 hypothetical protein [Saprospiraceae bacterium]HNQ41141.1 hypothetical protein [Saprospiraceae bacterium]
MIGKALLPFVFIMAITTAGFGQFAIDVGYSGSTIINNPLRPIIHSFNSYLPEKARTMRRMYYLSSIHAGIGMVDQPVNFNLEYNGTFSSNIAKKLLRTGGAEYNYILNYSVNAFGPSFNFALGDKLCLGAAGLYNIISIKDYYTDTKDRTSLASSNIISVKPFLGINLGSGEARVTTSLRFFANLPFKAVDITNVYSKLDPEARAGLKDDDLNPKFTSVGVSLIIHNRM